MEARGGGAYVESWRPEFDFQGSQRIDIFASTAASTQNITEHIT